MDVFEDQPMPGLARPWDRFVELKVLGNLSGPIAQGMRELS